MGKNLGTPLDINISHNLNKYICISMLVAISFCFSTKILAEESLSTTKGKPRQDGFDSRLAKPEPDFFFSGSSSELKRFYLEIDYYHLGKLLEFLPLHLLYLQLQEHQYIQHFY